METVANSGPLSEGHQRSNYARLLNFFAALAGVMILFAMMSVTLDVLLRATGSGSLTWSFEVTEFILLYVPMLAMPWLARHRAHVQIDVFTSRLGPNPARHLDVAVCVLTAGVCLFMAYWSGLATVNAYERGIENAGMVPWPRWALLVAMPPAFTMTALEFVRIAWFRARREKVL